MTTAVVRWEYRFIPDADQDMRHFLDRLNKEGAEGWEAIQITKWGAYAKRARNDSSEAQR